MLIHNEDFTTEIDIMEITRLNVLYSNITLFDNILASCKRGFPSLLGSPNCFSFFPWVISQYACEPVQVLDDMESWRYLDEGVLKFAGTKH